MLTIAHVTWIPYALFIDAFSAAIYTTTKNRTTFDKSVLDERREKALEDLNERVEKKNDSS